MDLEKQREKYQAEQQVRAINNAMGFTERLMKLRAMNEIPGKPNNMTLILFEEIQQTERAIVSCFEKLPQ